MIDDLVKRLREAANLDLYGVHRDVEREAADRIEELEKFLMVMQVDVDFLRRLRAAGVDNWEGYEFALEDDDDR